MANLGFFQMLRKNKELIPLVGFVGFAAVGALSASLYFLRTKSDVIVNKSGNPEPWENVNPNQSQKFYVNQPGVEIHRGAGEGQKDNEVTSCHCLKNVLYESSGIISAQTRLLKSVCGIASATFLGSPYIFGLWMRNFILP
ncbi:unnamed protein product [Lepidochelys kempii]